MKSLIVSDSVGPSHSLSLTAAVILPPPEPSRARHPGCDPRFGRFGGMLLACLFSPCAVAAPFHAGLALLLAGRIAAPVIEPPLGGAFEFDVECSLDRRLDKALVGQFLQRIVGGVFVAGYQWRG